MVATGGVNNDADVDATYVHSGRYSCTLRANELYETPRYTASAETEWWVSGWFKQKSKFQANVYHMMWHCSNDLINGNFLSLYFYMDGSTNWTGIGLRRYTNAEATYGIATGAEVGTMYTPSAGEQTGDNWVQLHITDNGDGTFDAEVLVNDTSRITGTNIANVGNTSQMITGGAYSTSGKSTSSWAFDDFIINDTAGSAPYNARLVSTVGYVHQGYQAIADLSDYDEWTASTGTESYATGDDFNDTTDSADDYTEYTGGVANKSQMFCFAPVGSGETPVTVTLLNWQRVTGITSGQYGPDQYLAIATGESLAAGAWDYGYVVKNIVSWKVLKTTPEGATWTEDLFNAFKAGFKSTQAASPYRVYTFGIECFGIDLTRPSANVANDTDPCSLPVASAFVPIVCIF
jgi:hypothetical protein